MSSSLVSVPAQKLLRLREEVTWNWTVLGRRRWLRTENRGRAAECQLAVASKKLLVAMDVLQSKLTSHSHSLPWENLLLRIGFPDLR